MLISFQQVYGLSNAINNQAGRLNNLPARLFHHVNKEVPGVSGYGS